jgi:dephospho-CoA kinase
VLLVGLTGGIGSGKSTVGRMLEARGAVVLDADELARRAVEPGTPGHRRVVERFGEGVLGPDGRVDRERLARLVFAHPGARRDLEAIVHPEVARMLQEATAPYRHTDQVVVHVVPLLVEAGLAGRYDAVVTVVAEEDLRVARLVRDRGMAEEDVRARLRAQASDEDRARAADLVVRNDGTLQDLEREVDRVCGSSRSGPGAAEVHVRRGSPAGSAAQAGRSRGPRHPVPGPPI